MNSSSFAVAAAVVAMLCVAPSTGPMADTVKTALGCSGNPCVIKRNPGGEISAFEAAAREIKSSGRRVVVDGPCYSACAILADIARGNVCVTSRAKFGFHQGYVVGRVKVGGPLKLIGRFKPTHSTDIDRWVAKNGGFPRKGFRIMGVKQARKIWKRC